MRDQDGVPDLAYGLDLDLTVADIWGVNQQVEDPAPMDAFRNIF